MKDMIHNFKATVYVSLMGVVFGAQSVDGQVAVTTPMEQFGHELGADYVLPKYTDLYEYWQKLALESERMAVQDIGYTEEGRPQIMAVITAPENHANLENIRRFPGD